MTDFNTQMDTILAQNGLDIANTFGATKVRGIMVALQGADKFASAILPADLAIIKSQADVEQAIKRVVTDEAFFVSTLRALVLYVRAKFDGTSYDPAEITKFYELYTDADEGVRRIAQVGTLRILASIIADEATRSLNIDGKSDILPGVLKDLNDMVDSLSAGVTSGEIPTGAMYANMEESTALVMNLGQTLHRAEELGESVENARDINRRVGHLNGMQLNMLVDAIGGKLVEETFRHILPDETFNVVEALAQIESDKFDNGGVSRPTH